MMCVCVLSYLRGRSGVIVTALSKGYPCLFGAVNIRNSRSFFDRNNRFGTRGAWYGSLRGYQTFSEKLFY